MELEYDFVDGEKCAYCRQQPAAREYYLFPCWYFCSMECKTAYYTSPDEFPTKESDAKRVE